MTPSLSRQGNEAMDLSDFIDLDALFAMSNTERDRAIEAMSSETIELLMRDIAVHKQGVMK